MLYFPKTRASVSVELPIQVGSTVTVEGCALVADNTGGIFGVKASAGANTDVFLGVSISQELPLLTYPRVDVNVQPSGNIITLGRTPVSGTILVYDQTTAAALTVSSDYTISGKVVTLNSGTLGHTIAVYYKFQPTAAEARQIMGDTYPGGAAGTTYGQVGVLKSGFVYTTEYDSSVNWNQSPIAVKTGANGQFTIGGSGTAVPCTVIAPPTTAQPYLGLAITAA